MARATSRARCGVEIRPLLRPVTIYADIVPPERELLADRRHRLAPPPWRIYVALSEEIDRWLTLRPREVAPSVVKAVRPSVIEWSSLWPVSPDDSITFDIEPDGAGCAVRLRWWTASPPDERGVALVRHRLNNAIGGELRDFVDTCG